MRQWFEPIKTLREGELGISANALGRSRGGFSTKLHAVVDLQGRPLAMSFTPGQHHESRVAETLMDFVRGGPCLADGGYDADRIVAAIRDRGLVPVIPPSKGRNKKRRYDKALYRLRYRVEVFFHHIKRYRRIATRFDKSLPCYAAFVLLACILIWV